MNHVVNTIAETSNSSQSRHKMMMTSLVVLTGPTGEQMEVRAMLDSGAESSILSNKVMRTLKLKPLDEWRNISGIESPKQATARPTAQVTVSSPFNKEWTKTVTVVALPRVTIDLPRHH